MGLGTAERGRGCWWLLVAGTPTAGGAPGKSVSVAKCNLRHPPHSGRAGRLVQSVRYSRAIGQRLRVGLVAMMWACMVAVTLCKRLAVHSTKRTGTVLRMVGC